MERQLIDKVAIVTGGGAGIGEAICKRFASEGAKVVVTGFHEDPVDQVVDEILEKGGEAISYKGDMANEEEAEACVEFAVDWFGKLDILINNAGVLPELGKVEKFSSESFFYLTRNNIQSVFMMTKHALPELQKTKGCIVSAGSEAGLDGDAENAVYSSTKGWIHSFTRSIAVEQAQKGVRVNAVAPGPVDTSWMHVSEGPMNLKQKGTFLSAIPMGRMATVEEVANVYLFLASDLASYVTGSIYKVDGGITISKGPAAMMADSSMKDKPEENMDLDHTKEGHTSIRDNS